MYASLFNAQYYGNYDYLPYIYAIMQNGIIQIFKAQKGYLQSRQLKSRAQQYQLKKLVDQGDVVMVKRGLYKHVHLAVDNDWVEVCRIVPNGYLCLFSAWHFYEMTTHVPASYYMAIPNKAKIVLPTYPPVKIFYWSSEHYSLGRENLKSKEGIISIYNIEKSVCDAIKFRNKVGKEMTSEVLKNYLKRTDRNIDMLLSYSRVLRVEKILNQYMEVLL